MEQNAHMDDLKFYAVNLSALGLGIVQVNDALTTMTLIVGLGYGIHRWVLMARKSKGTK